MKASLSFSAKGGSSSAKEASSSAATRPPAPITVTAVDIPATVNSPEPTRKAPRRGWIRASVRVAGNLLMLAMVAGFTLVAVLPATGARAMIVLSGSMEPLLTAGDAAIITDVPAEDLEVDDVITFHGIGEDKRLTTHRIIDLVDLDSGLHFQTQGDANASPDVNLAPAGAVVGRYDGRVPHGGRALLLLSRPEAKILLVAVPALLILLGEIRTLLAAAGNRRHERAEATTRPVVVTVAMLLLAAVMGVAATMATMAVMTDGDQAGDNSFSTGTFP